MSTSFSPGPDNKGQSISNPAATNGPANPATTAAIYPSRLSLNIGRIVNPSGVGPSQAPEYARSIFAPKAPAVIGDLEVPTFDEARKTAKEEILKSVPV